MVFEGRNTKAKYMHYYGEVRALQERVAFANELRDTRLEKNLLNKLVVAIDAYESHVPKKLRETTRLRNMSDWRAYYVDMISQIELEFNQPSQF